MGAPAVVSRVTFERPFSLKGLPDLQAAGTYSIETTERSRWSFPFSWETETTTMIRVCENYGRDGSLFDFEICPRDFFAAMARDRPRDVKSIKVG